MIAFRFRRLTLAWAVLLASAAPACFAENEVASRRFPINAEGTVTVQTTSGVVRINIWDRDEVRVDVIKRPLSADLVDQLDVQFESGFNNLAVVADIAKEAGSFGETITAGTIDLGLTIPRNANIEIVATTATVRIEGVRGSVKAATTTGSITTLDLAGAVTLATTHGPLQVSFVSINEEQRIDVTSTYGSIRMLIPPSAAAHLDILAPRGVLKTDLPIEIIEDPDGGHRVDASINTGGAKIHCETQNGGILLLRRL